MLCVRRCNRTNSWFDSTRLSPRNRLEIYVVMLPTILIKKHHNNLHSTHLKDRRLVFSRVSSRVVKGSGADGSGCDVASSYTVCTTPSITPTPVTFPPNGAAATNISSVAIITIKFHLQYILSVRDEVKEVRKASEGRRCGVACGMCSERV